ncbi:MAG: rRNA (cytidine1920-2-O)/16S rRNA (cytidine1409-2-O)-methyltransferase [Patescibacteria group bacterium]|nr:rRNA (cytidine1920-2-O)/16S rRNA (cytidine1409-2-O)-methyltransferase [Patescibacteria group bacterium]
MDKRVRLDTSLVERGLCQSRTEAQELIKQNLVFVDGVLCEKSAKGVLVTSTIELHGKRKFVSRGGEKLHGALQDIFGEEKNIENHIKDSLALDIGSSTGGFSDCLLKYGVRHIDAVDVGSNQFHTQLRDNRKITLYENKDIRTFHSGKDYQIIVCDISFISTATMLPVIVSFAKEKRCHFFILIKPQFEVGRGNTKKGIVKDTSLTKQILLDVKNKAVDLNLKDIQLVPSRIQGGDGNQEYFLYGTK